MNTLLAQADIPLFTGNIKTWLLAITGLLLALIVGRFVQAFRNGAGLIDAVKAVLFGTNTPKGPVIALIVGLLMLGATGCTTNLNSKTTHVFQASGKGIKLGIVQDPVTGQYSLGYQSIFAGAMVVPIMAVQSTNGGPVLITTPDAVMSYELGGKGTFFGSGSSTVTFAVGPNAVQTILGGQHPPNNSPYWTKSAPGQTTLPVNGTTVPTVTSTGTNGATTQTAIVIKP